MREQNYWEGKGVCRKPRNRKKKRNENVRIQKKFENSDICRFKHSHSHPWLMAHGRGRWMCLCVCDRARPNEQWGNAMPIAHIGCLPADENGNGEQKIEHQHHIDGSDGNWQCGRLAFHARSLSLSLYNFCRFCCTMRYDVNIIFSFSIAVARWHCYCRHYTGGK